MIGKTLGHYEITGTLGKGGMGQVYRARDTKLDRDVAIKILPAGMASDPMRLERFRREAKTVASLSHPHIVALFSVEEDAGVHFLTMELVDGQGLERTIPSDGLPLSKVFDFGISIADALAAAHEKGIVHRDLKPANVMLSKDGRIKVLDFGLAKIAEKAGPSEDADTEIAPITTEGQVMGTVPYMSPEQLRGKEVDHRSDIFSLGILLYELATGRRPFQGESNADITSAILHATPPSLDQIRPELPLQLDRTVSRCLEKDPEDRYQSAKDIRNELRGVRRDVESGTSQPRWIVQTSAPASATTGGRRKAIWLAAAAAIVIAAVAALAFMIRDGGAAPARGAGTSVADERTIAVLPFVNLSADPSQGYFSDGISEELLNMLTKVRALRVAARTSSFSFKGRNVEIPEIGKRLNVAYVLEGSVRRADDRVRITAQLIRAGDGFHVWSETYDRKLDDIFAIQDDIAADVVKQLQITLLGDTPTTYKTNPETYALYLQSVQVGRQSTAEGFEQSDALLRRAIEIDPNYVPAWAGLGANFANRAVSGRMDPEEGFKRAREANEHALAADPKYAPAYAGLAFISMYGESDFAEAAEYLERALALDPANGRALGNSATLFNLLGRSGEAVSLWDFLANRDPVNVNARFNLGTAQLNAGRFDDAIASYRTVLSLSPGNGVAHYQLGVAMLLKGDGKGALAEFEQEPIEVYRRIGLPLAYHALGRKAESDAALAELVAKHEAETYYNIAAIHAFRGDADRAFAALRQERAFKGTFAEIVADRLFTHLHADPRWIPFLREIGKAPEQLAKIRFTVKLPQ